MSPHSSDPVSLTYCGNVHAAADVATWLELTERYAVPIAAAQRGAGRPFGLGTWWTAATAAELATDPRSFAAVQDFLVAHDLSIWTVNVFPFGDFHGTPVKERVYEPDWAQAERVRFTLDVAGVVARLGSTEDTVAMSSLPLGYAPGGHDAVTRQSCAHNLRRVARGLADLESAHGLRLVLALEPEPFCLLETVAAAATFLETGVFAHSDEDLLRRHLGVCIDLCHLAVVGEDPSAALADLRARGVACPKIQVSACLELRAAAGLDALLAFDEPVYLHQTVAADGTRALDLPAVAARREEFARALPVRTHFHTPVFWDEPESALGSTRELLRTALANLPRPLPLLEVETYTWGVLPGWDKSEAALRAGIANELQFVAAALANSRERD